MTFWLNGQFREDATAINIADRGFLLGDGVFETLLVERGTPGFLDAHLARLKSGLTALRIKAALPKEISEVFQELAERKGLSNDRASARLSVTRGVSGRGLVFPTISKPNVLLTLAAAPTHGEASVSLIISRFKRSEISISARFKTLNYLDNVLARSEADEAGADDAVMLNCHGRVACASAANLFILGGDGVVATPPTEEGALPGIVRELLVGGASQVGVQIRERPIAVEELRRSYVFLTNSLFGLRSAQVKGAEPASVVQVEVFNDLRAWYQRQLREDLQMKSASP